MEHKATRTANAIPTLLPAQDWELVHHRISMQSEWQEDYY